MTHLTGAQEAVVVIVSVQHHEAGGPDNVWRAGQYLNEVQRMFGLRT